MTKQQQIERANALKQIVENPYYIEAHEQLRSKLLREFENTRFEEASKRERIHMALFMHDALQKTMHSAIISGDHTRKQIAAISGGKPGVRDFFQI